MIKIEINIQDLDEETQLTAFSFLHNATINEKYLNDKVHIKLREMEDSLKGEINDKWRK